MKLAFDAVVISGQMYEFFFVIPELKEICYV